MINMSSVNPSKYMDIRGVDVHPDHQSSNSHRGAFGCLFLLNKAIHLVLPRLLDRNLNLTRNSKLTGSNKLCHWNGLIIGIIDKTIADNTPCS